MMVCDMFYWIQNHPKLCPVGIEANIEIIPRAVDPKTNEWNNEDHSKNTKDVYALELCVTRKFDPEVHGPYSPQGGDAIGCHEWEYDCGGDTMRDAVQAMYDAVLRDFGDYDEEEGNEHMLRAYAELHPNFQEAVQEMLDSMSKE